jgi:Arc/MetJ-type ribon-helix-helix transcriptional regulator
MVMDTLQIRLSSKILNLVDLLVESGLYSSRSDVVRDAVRKLILDRMMGIMPNNKDSVKEVRGIRKKLSKQIKTFNDIKKINKLLD